MLLVPLTLGPVFTNDAAQMHCSKMGCKHSKDTTVSPEANFSTMGMHSKDTESLFNLNNGSTSISSRPNTTERQSRIFKVRDARTSLIGNTKLPSNRKSVTVAEEEVVTL